MSLGDTGMVSFALVRLQRLARSFDEIGSDAEPGEAATRAALRLITQLGTTALPLCLRELGSDHAGRARWAEALIAHIGALAEHRERVVDGLQRLAGQSRESAPALCERACNLLADLGARLGPGDRSGGRSGGHPAGTQGGAQGGGPGGRPGEQSIYEIREPDIGDPDALRALVSQLRTPAEVALAADRVLVELDGEEVIALVDGLGDTDPVRAIWLADELLLRNDLGEHIRHALRRVRAPLDESGVARPRPPGGQGLDLAQVAVLLGRRPGGRQVVIASRPLGAPAPDRVRVLCLLATGDGTLIDGLHGRDFPARRLEREVLAPLRQRGYRFTMASPEQGAQEVRRMARATLRLGRPLPQAFYLGRDLLGIYDQHVAGLRAAPGDSPLLERGLQLLLEGSPERARPILERFVRRAPDHAEGRAALARCLVALDVLEPARAHLLQAMALDPDNPLHHWNLAAIAHRQGRPGGCYLALLDYLDLVGDGVFDAGAGACDARLETATGFVEEYERLAQIEYPEAAPAAVARADDLVHRARLRLEASEQDAALALLEQAVAMVPEHYPAWTDLGMFWGRRGRRDEAGRCLRKALALRPGCPVASRAMARLEGEGAAAQAAAASECASGGMSEQGRLL